MPIGFERADSGSSSASGSAVDLTHSPRPVAPEQNAPWIDSERERPTVRTVWTRWRTQEDERVCPVCGPLDGNTWPEDAGPTPPLHNHCRCLRVVAFIEYAVRGS